MTRLQHSHSSHLAIARRFAFFSPISKLLVGVSLLAGSCLLAEPPARVQTFLLRDTTGLIAPKVKTEAANYLGRKSVRITALASRCCREPTFRME
jgi:hypothetical protein